MSAQTNALNSAKTMLDDLQVLEEEMGLVLAYTASLFLQHKHHFPHTSYGFVMCLFSKIDLFSQYWFPFERKQTIRMAAFLIQHLGYGMPESDIAVHPLAALPDAHLPAS